MKKTFTTALVGEGDSPFSGERSEPITSMRIMPYDP